VGPWWGLGGLLPLVSGLGLPFVCQFPLLDRHLRFLQPGLALLGGQFTLFQPRLPHVSPAAATFLHDMTLHPYAPRR